MFNLVWAQSRNWTSRVLDRQSGLPWHFYGSPVAIPFLVAVCVVLLLIWFLIHPLSFWQFFGMSPSVPSRHSADQLGGVLSVNQTKAAFDALVASMGDQILEQNLPLILVRPAANDSIHADDEGDEQLRVTTVSIDQYPYVEKLVPANARIIDVKSMSSQLLQAGSDEKLRHIIESDAIRLSDAIEASCAFHTYPDARADPHELTKESTKSWVCKLKIITRLLCLMRCQLDEQDWKEDYFAGVAGPYIRVLMEVASAFSSANWTTGDVLNMVPIFEAFLDSLCNIKQSLSTQDLAVEVADIFCNVVDAFKVIIGGSENDLQRSEECAIISATYYLIVALEFFYRNRNVQPILASENSLYRIDLCKFWISKVEEDGKRLFPNEGDRQYIFILNNTYFVWEKKCRGEGFLSAETVKDWFKTLIEKYIKMYVDEYWVPLGQYIYIEGDCQIKPCRSRLVKFITEFDKKCTRQMKWKVVQPELRNTLRIKIKILLVRPYDNFLASLVAMDLSSESSDKKKKILSFFKKIERAICIGEVDISSKDDSAGTINVYSVRDFAVVIKNLYEG